MWGVEFRRVLFGSGCSGRPALRMTIPVFDVPGKPEWSFEGLVVRYNPRHRWSYFSNMTREEALVFKTNDSDPKQPHHVPHTAFNDPTCPAGVAPRASIEMRAIAYWFGA